MINKTINVGDEIQNAKMYDNELRPIIQKEKMYLMENYGEWEVIRVEEEHGVIREKEDKDGVLYYRGILCEPNHIVHINTKNLDILKEVMDHYNNTMPYDHNEIADSSLSVSIVERCYYEKNKKYRIKHSATMTQLGSGRYLDWEICRIKEYDTGVICYTGSLVRYKDTIDFIPVIPPLYKDKYTLSFITNDPDILIDVIDRYHSNQNNTNIIKKDDIETIHNQEKETTISTTLKKLLTELLRK